VVLQTRSKTISDQSTQSSAHDGSVTWRTQQSQAAFKNTNQTKPRLSHNCYMRSFVVSGLNWEILSAFENTRSN